jgi:sialic acid synthase SpsE
MLDAIGRRAPGPLTIAGRPVGGGASVYIVAEAGINHNGDPALALRLVRLAAAAGADAVKFQRRAPRVLLSREAYDRPYTGPQSYGATYGQHREALELPDAVWRDLTREAQGLGVALYGSAWDPPSVDALAELGVPALKIPSAGLTDPGLLEHAAATGLPLIVSTGMCTWDELDAALGGPLRPAHARLVLLHCISAYPAEPEDLRLRLIPALRSRYALPVGWSGHERGLATTMAAVALGACMVERHVTVDRTMRGSDHAASLEPGGLVRLVRDIRHVESALRGPAVREVLAAEAGVRARLGKSLATARAVRAGSLIAAGDLTMRSPGDGLPARCAADLLGRTWPADYEAGVLLPRAALEWL